MMPDTSTSKPRKECDRPFPWPCGNCLQDEVYSETMPYAADVKHDGQLYHLEIPALRIPKCRACGELVFSNSVDDQILQALREHLRLLTPEQIRGGRKALSLKSKEFADKLGIAAETISRWERGGLVQSRAMDNFLRVYFAVPEVRRVLRGDQQDPALGTPVNEDEAINATTLDVFTPRYVERAEQLFLRPGVQYRWDEIVNGVCVQRQHGRSEQMWAVAPNTFRSFYRFDKKLSGAQAAFQQYFTEQRPRLIGELGSLSERGTLHQLCNDIHTEILRRLTNIKREPSHLDSYNKIRKPIDLYLEHLVAMSSELEEGQRRKLVPLLYLPLDSQILQCSALFSKAELDEQRLLTSKPTYAAVTDEKQYLALQQIISRRADEVAKKVKRPFYPIYFDLLWNHRYRNWGTNLFETNPLRNHRCA